ncbi:MAG: SufD family Fe-S cluster assembly protein [Spirochaetota bacterium]
MTSTLTQEKHGLDELFRDFVSKQQEPEWLSDIRKQAFAQLQKTHFPNSQMEAWRKFPLQNLNIQSLLQNLSQEAQQPARFDSIAACTISSFQEVAEKDRSFVTSSLQGLVESYKDDFFSLLTLAFSTQGVFCDVEKGAQVDLLNIQTQITATAGLPIFLLRVQAFAKVFLSESYGQEEPESFGLVAPLAAIYQEESSQLHYNLVDNFSASTFHIRRVHSQQKRDSSLELSYFYLKGYRGKAFFDNLLNEPGSRFKGIGVATAIKREYQDLEMTVSHLASHTESEIIYKSVVKDKSHHVFTGNLIVPQTSKHVAASQLNNNLMLSKTARAESIPKLEVFAEDVQCIHGATVGEIEEEQLFYILSRGIKESDARLLLLEAFLSSIIDLIPQQEIADGLKGQLIEKLGV